MGIDNCVTVVCGRGTLLNKTCAAQEAQESACQVLTL